MKKMNAYFATDAGIQIATIIVVLMIAIIIDWILC